jgi:hypothetical protein
MPAMHASIMTVLGNHDRRKKIDVHAQLSYQSWSVDVSANNVTNRYVQVTGGPGFFPEYSAAVLQPRTIGVSLRKTF